MRLLYLMHVDWRWIKQRPHFIAEHLAEKHDVLAAFRINPARGRLSGNTSRVHRIPLLPIPRRWGRWSERLDSFFQKIWVGMISLFFRPDAVWITFPTIFSYLPFWLGNVPIVYDCMDDAGCFYKDPRTSERVKREECRLVGAASKVLCSSRTLMERLSERCGNAEKMELVRNGISEDLVETVAFSDEPHDEKKAFTDLAYVGTISEWFDFPLVVSALDKMPSLRLHLIGPADCEIPKHDRIVYHGVVDRAGLREFVKPFDAFVMPFIVNPLIEGVDPVKLYEYIAFGKPVVCVFYREVERFGPYVHLYSTADEFDSFMERLCSGDLELKADSEKVKDFLKESTWSKRAEGILDSLPVGR